MATTAITVTAAWVSTLTAGKKYNVQNIDVGTIEYRVQAAQPNAGDRGLGLPPRATHPVDLPAGETLWVRVSPISEAGAPLAAIAVEVL